MASSPGVLDEARKFAYDTLSDPNNLRVLALYPSNNKNAELICDIIESSNPARDTHGFDITLKQFWGYEALSWCWSSDGEIPEETLTINVGPAAKSFFIPRDLSAALQAIRLEGQKRYIWVDYICINQNDTKEKNHQVARMSQIYKEAKNVCVWLGVGDKHSQRALAFIRDRLTNVYLFDKLLSKEHVDNWMALLMLLKRPWFHRRWIVQEIALASTATIHCGVESIPWDDFTSAVSLLDKETIEVLHKLVQDHEDHGHPERYFKEVPSLSAVILIRVTEGLLKTNAAGNKTLTSNLEAVVAELATFETTEPRDIIYALLALAKDSQRAIGSPTEFFMGKRLEGPQKKAIEMFQRIWSGFFKDEYRIRYEDDIVDVYQHFISYAISRADGHRALDIICRPFAKSYTREQNDKYKGDNKTKSPSSPVPNGSTSPVLSRTDSTIVRPLNVKLPSWIADIANSPMERKSDYNASANTSGKVTSYNMERRRGDLFISNPDQASYYNASTKAYNKEKVFFRRRPKHFSMFVEGFVLDQIVRTHGTSNSGEIPESWFKLRQQFSEPTDDGRNAEFLKRFSRTMAADRNIDNKVQQPFYQSTLNTILDTHTEGGSIATLNTENKAKTASKPVREVLMHVHDTIFARQLVQTKRYNLLGLAPAETQEGDLVCILFGCSVPVILRKCGEKEIEMESRYDEAIRMSRLASVTARLKDIIAKKRKNRKSITVEDARKNSFVQRHMTGQTGSITTGTAASTTRRNTSPAVRLNGPSAEQERRHTLPSARPEIITVEEDEQASSVTEAVPAPLQDTSSIAILEQPETRDTSNTMFVSSRWPRLSVLLVTILLLLFILEELLLATVLSLLATIHILSDMLQPFDDSRSLLIAVVSILTVPSTSSRLSQTLLQAIVVIGALFFGIPALMPVFRQHKSTTDEETAPDTSDAIAASPTALEPGNNAKSPNVNGDSVANATGSTQVAASTVPEMNEKLHPETTPPEGYRNHDSHRFWYELVGESYMDSVMNGEALEMQSESAGAKKEGEENDRIWNVQFELR